VDAKQLKSQVGPGDHPATGPVDISVLVTVHNEGSLLYRTLRCLQRCIDFTRASGRTVETTIVIDRATSPRLLEIAREWQKESERTQIQEVDYGCLARSRNHGVRESSGQFMAFLDGDDMFCRDWLVKAHEVCSANPKSIAHPEITYYFPRDRVGMRRTDMSHYQELLEYNLWQALAMAHRSVYEQVPYQSDTEDFGYEDWLWNCETISAGFVHVNVAQTLMAIRQKPPAESLCHMTAACDKSVAPNRLFREILSQPVEICHGPQNKVIDCSGSESDSLRDSAPSYEGPTLASAAGGHDERACQGNFAMRRDPLEAVTSLVKKAFFSARLGFLRKRIPPQYRHAIREILRSTKEVVKITLSARGFESSPLPLWAEDELVELARIDPTVGPPAPWLIPPNPPARICRHVTPGMRALMKAQKSRVYILNSLEIGGTELVAIHYMSAVRENVFVITTHESSNPWSRALPTGTVLIDIGNTGLSDSEKILLLQRLLLEADMDFVHTIHSGVGLDLFIKKSRTFRGKRMFASFFSTGVSPSGYESGYAISHFPYLLDFFVRVSTDNASFKHKMEVLFGVPKDLIVPHHMPVSSPGFPMAQKGAPCSTEPITSQPADRPLKLFFAGRLSSAKRPEIAAQAVKKLLSEGADITLDIWGPMDRDYRMEIPRRTEIRMRGTYSGLSSIGLSNYDAMILPSQWEGLPNVVIECMGNGIPVIAANVGGVGELVSENTGWLVDDTDNPEAYKEVIRNILKDREALRAKGDNARTLVEKKHSWANFQQEVKEFYEAPPLS
jgi:glycosyltransferase involved in cell wall biosynthesis